MRFAERVTAHAHDAVAWGPGRGAQRLFKPGAPSAFRRDGAWLALSALDARSISVAAWRALRPRRNVAHVGDGGPYKASRQLRVVTAES